MADFDGIASTTHMLGSAARRIAEFTDRQAGRMVAAADRATDAVDGATDGRVWLVLEKVDAAVAAGLGRGESVVAGLSDAARTVAAAVQSTAAQGASRITRGGSS